MKGPYALWGCGHGYVQIGSAVDRHEQRVEARRWRLHFALIGNSRQMRRLGRVNVKMGVSLREMGKVLERWVASMNAPPRPPQFKDWDDTFEWM